MTPMRARLAEIRERMDRERGRPLTAAEQIANLARAMKRICPGCGYECEPGARCQCGTINRET